MLDNLDLKNEEINFKDSGCRFSSSCLSCPIEICIYDDPALVRNLEKSIRDNNIIKDRAEGLSNKQIANKCLAYFVARLSCAHLGPVALDQQCTAGA